MTAHGIFQITTYFIALIAVAIPLGRYMARVYQGEPVFLNRMAGPLEKWIYRHCRINADEEMTWKAYAGRLVIFSLMGCLVVYLLQRLQGFLPLNPHGLPAVPPDLAFNTAVSFVTNTNWQAYGGETTLSFCTQMLGMTVQNFVSAAAGMAVLMAFIRGLKRTLSPTIGNVWVDLTRTILYILLPLSLVLALFLVSQGVVQTLQSPAEVGLLEQAKDGAATAESVQEIRLGPAASQVAIKQLGTNGGGFFNANSAHPLENPTPLSNFLEMLAILLIPVALCITFGRMLGDGRQGWALLAAMMMILIPLLGICLVSEQAGNPSFRQMNVDQSIGALQSGGNMEGKEVRFGIANSALWAAVTTAASSGSVNAMHDSFTPLGGLVPLVLMQLGEIIFGGAGSGLYGMLMFVLITVFIAGLMVGRTPEYLGKKIEAFEIKMAALVILIPAAVVLIGTGVAVVTRPGLAGILNTGPHGFSEILYAFSSAANNNGSAFAGLNANTPFYNLTLGFAMLIGRFGLIIPVLATAGSLAQKKCVSAGAGTLPTHTPLFVMFLVAVIMLVGALTFVPALVLGPIAEHLAWMRS
ncbi:MAG TPA: potassium-transporting ATPase subunit KdpA [Syntrophus sp. (in: bacteria)]|nr:potassium-transporting ATPase subunit KdpA [Syntrophus sp. (in: bacteria)]